MVCGWGRGAVHTENQQQRSSTNHRTTLYSTLRTLLSQALHLKLTASHHLQARSLAAESSLGYAAEEQWSPDANLGQRSAFPPYHCSGLCSLGPVIKIVPTVGRPNDNLFKSSIGSKVLGGY